MKRAKSFVSIAICVFMLLSILSLGVQASATDISDFEYLVTPDNTIDIRSYSGTAEVLQIPDTIEGLPVTEISMFAFMQNKTIKDLIIPNSVTTIGYAAFFDCLMLETITIGSGLSTLSPLAFNLSNNLSEITVSTQNKYFSSSDGILYNKDMSSILLYPTGKELTTFVMPNTVTNVGSNAFQLNYLENIVFSKKLKTIESEAFLSSVRLQSINLPDSVETIGYKAFSDNIEVDSIIIGNGVKTISGYAFASNLSLTHLQIGSNVKTIEENAFYNCLNLEEVSIPSTVTSISNYAFGYYAKGSLETPVKMDTFKIYGTANSHAQTYAQNNGFEFSSETPITIGDINNDGNINSIDVLTLQKHLANISVLNNNQLLSADTSKNGSVSSADLLLIQKYIAGIIGAF